jgi:phospholipase C
VSGINSSGTRLFLLSTCALAIAFAVGCRGVSSAPTQVGTDTLQVSVAGGTGTISSSPAGISCPSTCSATYNTGTQVTLTETPGGGSGFAGWGGACSGMSSTCTVTLSTNQSVSASFNQASGNVTLTVTTSGTAQGTVASSPAGISCPGTCSASFADNTQVTLTETPGAPSTFAAFAGWGGACSGTAPTCSLTLTADQSVTATFNPGINHIVFLAQENRSFDHYFGELRQWWADNGYPDQAFDGLAQFNPPAGSSPAPSNPPCSNPDPTSHCNADPTGTPVVSDHLPSVCIENPSPSWNESHVDWDYQDPVGKKPATLNGFVQTAANDARENQPPFLDTEGYRAMGYYTGDDLNFYYFMATNFATSDRLFSPVMSRTQPNRMFMMSGTSQGHAYPLGGSDPFDQSQLTAPPIFQALQNAGITWKIYVQPDPEAHGDCPPNDSTPQCLYLDAGSYLQMFTYGKTVINDPTLSQNLVPMSQFATDSANGTLPQVAWIESPTDAGLDEHPSVSDSDPINIQAGAAFVEEQINALMQGKNWSDSVFIFTYDENGGLFDHVSPQPMPSPDGITPQDLRPGDICNGAYGTGPTCDFVFTGYRVPFFIVGPYVKKNYVSHTVADTTAVLKLIETRFGLPALTKRDAAQFDMTEFFDFTSPSWATPPNNVPKQNRGGTCSLQPPPP